MGSAVTGNQFGIGRTISGFFRPILVTGGSFSLKNMGRAQMLCALPKKEGKAGLEHVLQSELKVALSLRGVDKTKGGPDGGVGCVQDGMVEGVDGFGAELKALAFDDVEALGDAEVDSLKTGAGEAANLTVAEAAGGLRDGAGIEPGVAGVTGESGFLIRRVLGWTVAVRTSKAGGGTGVVGRLCGEGEAVVELEDGVGLPAADDEIRSAGDVGAELPSTAEG